MRDVSDVLTVAELRDRARRLPAPVFDLIDAGAGDEVTLRANAAALAQVALRPRTLVDVATTSLETTVLGERVSLPVLLAPCGFAWLVDPEGERAVARAAGRAQTVYAVSGGSGFDLAGIARVATGPLWAQLYLRSSGTENDALVENARAAGVRTLCLTVDGVVQLARDRDYRNRVTVPLPLSFKTVVQGRRAPRWTWNYLRGRVARRPASSAIPATPYWQLGTRVVNAVPVTLADVRRLREQWSGTLVVKGILRGEDCGPLVDCGVDGIVVSNHGGRMLDGVVAAIDALPEVVAAVDGRCEVYVDGGFRRGVDVLKALALGARACLVGRPYLWALADGERGVDRLLEIFRTELAVAFALAGVRSVDEIGPDLVRRS